MPEGGRMGWKGSQQLKEEEKEKEEEMIGYRRLVAVFKALGI